MLSIRRVAIAATAAGLLTLGLAPALPAGAGSRIVITVSNAPSYQFYWYCSDSPPYPCNLQGSAGLQFDISRNVASNQPVIVGYQLVDGTAVAGQDFSGPTSGTVTIAANAYTAYLDVPVVNEGYSDATETLTVKLTSSSVPADISSTGTGTIYPGAQIPADCSLSWDPNSFIALTCTGRPATQTWYLLAGCTAIRYFLKAGNTVTGEGTSTVGCPYPDNTGLFIIYS